MARPKRVGILTAGGESRPERGDPGARQAALGRHGMQLVGFRDGFRGLADDHRMRLDSPVLAGILTVGGTILGTSRDKPHRMPRDGAVVDMTPAIVATYERRHLDAIVCLGGGGTQKNALRLAHAGLNVITLPKTIDNDVPRPMPRSASPRPWRSPPRPSTGSTARPTATTASSSPRSWVTGPAG